MDITTDIKALQKIVPKVVITVSWTDKHVKYECDLRYAEISPEEHDSYFQPIKDYFGDRLIERYSMCTGHFYMLNNKTMGTFQIIEHLNHTT